MKHLDISWKLLIFHWRQKRQLCNNVQKNYTCLANAVGSVRTEVRSQPMLQMSSAEDAAKALSIFFLDAVGISVRTEVVSRPMLQNFPMKMQKGGIEYLAAVTRSGQEFQETNSEVCVTIPRQGRAILWQKIYTEFSQFKGIVPEEECMIGPVVELHTSNRSSQPS